MSEAGHKEKPLDDQPLTAAIVSFAVDTPASAVPATALDSAKKLVLNTIGVALGASNRQVGKIMAQYVGEMGSTPPSATVLGARLRASPPMAALANGTMAHSLSLDSGNHLTTHVIPAALALAEHRCLSGPDLLDAVAIGFEVGAKLTASLGQGFGERGWWHPGLVGPIDAAVTAARLLRLDRRQMAMAIGIASCNSGGFRRSMGSMAQALHSGNAAHDGVQAALLAEKGFTADAAIIEAPLGFLAAITRLEERNLSPLLDRLGRPFALEQWPGVKPFPVSSPAQPLIDAVQMLREKEAFSLDDLAEIEADLHFFSLFRCPPKDENEAGFCGAYALATALVHGRFGFDQISAEAIRDARVLALMKRVRHVPSVKKDVDKVALKFGGGKSLSVEVPNATRRLFSDADLGRLFHECAERVLPKAAADELERLALQLDTLPTIDRLMALAGGFG